MRFNRILRKIEQDKIRKFYNKKGDCYGTDTGTVI